MGNSISFKSLSSNSEKICPWIWFTSTKSLWCHSANMWATVFPTTSDPGSPGVVVTQILSTFSINWGSKALSTLIICSEWSLEAISGTTPPYAWWSGTWEYAISWSTTKVCQSRRTIPSEVSSQLVSIANVFICVKC